MESKKHSPTVHTLFKYLEGIMWKKDWDYSELIPKGNNHRVRERFQLHLRKSSSDNESSKGPSEGSEFHGGVV